MDLHPILKRDYQGSCGFELGHGKNKEARISMWQPLYLKEVEEGLENFDVEAVIDCDVHKFKTRPLVYMCKCLFPNLSEM